MNPNAKPGAPAAKKILVGISGGIGSAVASALLKNQGFSLQGLHLRLRAEDDRSLSFGGACEKQLPISAVEAICKKVGIPCSIEEVSLDFDKAVNDPFVHDSLAQKMPDPCVRCHRDVRLRALFKVAAERGIDTVATGHRAELLIQAHDGVVRLRKSSASGNDQSAFLASLSSLELRKLLLPLGGLSENMVQRLGTELGLEEFIKAGDSAESGTRVCGRHGAEAFLESRIAPALRSKGMVRTIDGHILNEHTGLHRFHLGTTDGLEGVHEVTERGLVAVAFDVTQQAVILGKEIDLMHRNLLGERAHWISEVDRLREFECEVEVRGSAEGETKAHVMLFEGGLVRVRFEKPRRALSAGQSLIFRQSDEVLGTATVERVLVETEAEKAPKKR